MSVEAQFELRPLASPLALRLLRARGGTFVLDGLQLEWVEAGEAKQVAFGSAFSRAGSGG